MSDAPTGASNLPPEWHQTYADWGRDLLREYPNGLGWEPKFAEDGDARMTWSSRGFTVQQKAFGTIGETSNIPIAGKTYSAYPSSVEDQTHIAHVMFQLANNYWAQAKAEADREAAIEKAKAIAEQEYTSAINRYSRDISTADTIKGLESKAEDLRDQIEATRRGDGKANLALLQEKLSLTHRRMIELERKSTQLAWRWTKIGVILGVIGLVVGIGFPVWDIVHRPAAENTHMSSPPQPQAPPQPQTGSPPEHAKQ